MKLSSWFLLVAVAVTLLQQVVESEEVIDSDFDEIELNDAEMAREVMKKLAILSDVQQLAGSEENRNINKRGWRLRRAIRRGVRRLGRWARRNPDKVIKVIGVLGKK